MDRGFSSVHPMVCFIYYALIILYAMLLLHPVYLLLSLTGGILFLMLRKSRTALAKSWAYFLLMGVVVFLVNPLLNHRGSTILFYLFDNPVTLEATVYGAGMSLSLLAVMAAFGCYQEVVDNHKFLYLFSAILPKTAFLIMMSLRFVPLLLVRSRQISTVQKTRGVDLTSGSAKKRMKDGMHILHILITWSLEEALQTADSMKARGYGVTRRSSYWNYKMDRRDWSLLTIILILAAVTMAGWYLGYGTLDIYPALGPIRLDGISLAFYAVFFLLVSLSIIVEEREKFIWR